MSFELHFLFNFSNFQSCFRSSEFLDSIVCSILKFTNQTGNSEIFWIIIFFNTKKKMILIFFFTNNKSIPSASLIKILILLVLSVSHTLPLSAVVDPGRLFCVHGSCMPPPVCRYCFGKSCSEQWPHLQH